MPNTTHKANCLKIDIQKQTTQLFVDRMRDKFPNNLCQFLHIFVVQALQSEDGMLLNNLGHFAELNQCKKTIVEIS